jgi:hypothetical protein
MPIFYTNTGSLNRLEVSGSTVISGSLTPLQVIGSGSAILSITGNTGLLLEVGDVSATGELFTISSGSIDILTVDSAQLMTVSGTIYVIAPSASVSIASFEGNANDYLELYVQNLNSGVSASTDIVAYSNTGTATSSFIDMGINSSGVAIGYSFGNANDSYVYNTGGHLYIGNNTAFFQPAVTEQSLFLFANASGSPDMAISGGRVGIRKTGSLNATLDINGSLTVTGSTALSGALDVVGAITSPTIDALSNAISAVSTTVATVSALAPGGASQVGLQNAINALSNRISAIPGGATSVNPTRYVSVANTLNTAALVGLSGMTVSVSAGVIYEFEGQIMYSVSAATGNAFGLVWPTANRVAGVWAGGTSVNQTGASTFSTMAFGDFDTGDSNSAVWSAAVGAVGLHFIKVGGIIDAQNTGAIYPVARSSAAANTLVIARGSYFRVARIN